MYDLLPQMPNFHTALAEWMAAVIFIWSQNKRISRQKQMMFMGVMLAIQLTFQYVAPVRAIKYWYVCVLIAIWLIYKAIYSLCEMSNKDAVYCSIRAYMIAQLAASLEWQIYCYFIYPLRLSRGWDLIWQTGIMTAVYWGIYYIAFRLEWKYRPQGRDLNVGPRELTTAIVFALIAFMMGIMSFLYDRTPFSARYAMETYIIRTVCDFAGTALLYGHFILNFQSRATNELHQINTILKRQYDQYQMSKENIELLNMRFHDMKNQIAAIRAEDNAEKKESYLTDLENHLKLYEMQSKTGNKVLDMVLQAKNIVCLNQDIQITCVADGELLDFIDPMDISTIFGNALDNAIECEMRIRDISKRMIHTAVFKKHHFVMIRFENYFEGHLEPLVDGFPATSKAEKGLHGYGLKSIRYSAERYGGTVTVNHSQNWFELKILIPIPRDKDHK